VQVTRLRLAELLQVQRVRLSQQLARLDDVGFNFFRARIERVRLALPEVIDQADDLVRL
jgi:hypothetical protein